VNESGTGLGLSMCKFLIEKFKGKIQVQTKLNHGTKFLFTIQAREALSDLDISS